MSMYSPLAQENSLTKAPKLYLLIRDEIVRSIKLDWEVTMFAKRDSFWFGAIFGALGVILLVLSAKLGTESQPLLAITVRSFFLSGTVLFAKGFWGVLRAGDSQAMLANAILLVLSAVPYAAFWALVFLDFRMLSQAGWVYALMLVCILYPSRKRVR